MTLQKLEQLEQELAALPGEENYQRQLDANRHQRAVLEWQIQTIRAATAAVANADLQSAAEQAWFDHLSTWRQALGTELLAIKSPIRDLKVMGRARNLELSISCIDRGCGVFTDTGWELETSALGALMRGSGYVEGPRIENQGTGPLPWFGSMPDVEARLKALQAQRDSAQAQLADALLTDEERERIAAERRAAFNATGQLKVRGDGSQYLRFSDGRPDVEVPT